MKTEKPPSRLPSIRVVFLYSYLGLFTRDYTQTVKRAAGKEFSPTVSCGFMTHMIYALQEQWCCGVALAFILHALFTKSYIPYIIYKHFPALP